MPYLYGIALGLVICWALLERRRAAFYEARAHALQFALDLARRGLTELQRDRDGEL
jgi:hypothetical protein